MQLKSIALTALATAAFSLSLTLVCTCCFAGCFLWKNEHTATQKRVSLDAYYYKELFDGHRGSWYEWFHPELINRGWGSGHIEETKANMLKDGYDRAQIKYMDEQASATALQEEEAEKERERTD